MDRWREVSRYVISAGTKWCDTVQLQRKTIAIHISTCRAWMRRHYCVVAMTTSHLSIIFFFHIKIFCTFSNSVMIRLSQILRRRRIDKITKFFRRSIVCPNLCVRYTYSDFKDRFYSCYMKNLLNSLIKFTVNLLIKTAFLWKKI